MKCAFSVTQLCKIYRKCFQIYFHLEEKLNEKVFVLPRVETHVRQCSSSTIKTDVPIVTPSLLSWTCGYLFQQKL